MQIQSPALPALNRNKVDVYHINVLFPESECGVSYNVYQNIVVNHSLVHLNAQ